MTEKRFTNDRWQIYDNGKILSVSETEKLLNKLHDENEQLKQDNQRLKAQLNHIEYRFTEYRNKVGK